MILRTFVDWAEENRWRLSAKDFQEAYLRDFIPNWATFKDFPVRQTTDLVFEIINSYNFICDIQILRNDDLRNQAAQILEKNLINSWNNLKDLATKEEELFDKLNGGEENETN